MPANQQIYTIQEAARGLGVGSKALFKKLRDLNILDAVNVPYPRYVQQKYFVIERKSYYHQVKGWQISFRTKVTIRGIDFIDLKINGPQQKGDQANECSARLI